MFCSTPPCKLVQSFTVTLGITIFCLNVLEYLHRQHDDRLDEDEIINMEAARQQAKLKKKQAMSSEGRWQHDMFSVIDQLEPVVGHRTPTCSCFTCSFLLPSVYLCVCVSYCGAHLLRWCGKASTFL